MDRSFSTAMSEERANFKKNIENYRDIDRFARTDVPEIKASDSEDSVEDEETLRLLDNITDLDPLLDGESIDGIAKAPKIDPSSALDCSSIFIQIFQTQKVIIANQQKIERRLHALETTFEENAVDKVALMAQNKCIRECKVLVSKVLSGVSRLTQKLDDEEAKALKSDKPNDPVAVPENFQYMGLPMDELQIEISASFPMASIDAIKDFEEKLEQKEYVNAMALYLNQLKGSNGTLDKVFRKVMTDDLIFAFNYDGRNTKRALSKLKLINHVLYGVFSEEGRDQFEKAIRKSVDMSHNRMHQKKFQKNKNPSGSVTVKTGKKRRQSESSM